MIVAAAPPCGLSGHIRLTCTNNPTVTNYCCRNIAVSYVDGVIGDIPTPAGAGRYFLRDVPQHRACRHAGVARPGPTATLGVGAAGCISGRRARGTGGLYRSGYCADAA